MNEFIDKVFKYTVNVFKYTAIAIAGLLWFLLLISIIYHMIKFIGTLI